MCDKFINLARLGIIYNFIFYCVVLTQTISDKKPSSFFTGRSGKDEMFQLYSILDKCLFYGNFKYHKLFNDVTENNGHSF